MRDRDSHYGRRARFERLEDRTVLNGTVMVTNAGGVLTITGDAASNYYQVQQIGTTPTGGVKVRVIGFATQIQNLDTGKTGTSFTFDGVMGLTIDELAGGNNHVTVVNTNFATTGSLTIDMGAGNDILAVVNVKALDATITLGAGNDVASFVVVKTTAGDFTLDADGGRDTVVLNTVRAGTSTAPTNITVEMGPGSRDLLSVVLSSAATATFNDTGGTDGILAWKHGGNKFTTEIDSGFEIVV